MATIRLSESLGNEGFVQRHHILVRRLLEIFGYRREMPVKSVISAYEMFQRLGKDAMEESVEFIPSPASSPTSAMPGSKEKIGVLAERMANGEELWHPDDATWIKQAQEAASALEARILGMEDD